MCRIFRSKISAVILILCLQLCVVFIYSFGWNGSWHFDDAPNLMGLSNIFLQGFINKDVALDYIFSGDAGPLGRPIALASFLIDGSGWPSYPLELLRTNTLLHMVNGLLLWGVLFNLGSLRKWSEEKAAWLASAGAGIWILLPISVSSVLMAVQRMTVLSSGFMLLGLWLYLLGRSEVSKSTPYPWILMIGGLGGSTLLGIFTKEQAAILPILVWVIESYWLRKPELNSTRSRLIWKCFRVIFFYVPTLIVIFYLLRFVLDSGYAYSLRNYGLSERLWTESVILWDYIRLIFLPRSVAFGPFHDDYNIYKTFDISIFFVFSWIIVFVVFFLIRKKTSLPLYALVWYWVAHLIESSVVPLELYFEHRNYLASIMPLFAALVLFWEWGERQQIKAIIGLCFCVYGIILAGVLLQTTSLYGQPLLASHIWYEKHPSSVRAGQFLAQNEALLDDLPGALNVLDKTAERRPLSGALSLQGLQLACALDRPMDELKRRQAQVMQEISLATQRFSVISTLDKLKTLSEGRSCDGFITTENLLKISQLALDNPRIASSPQERSNLNIFMASLYIDAKQLEPTMNHLLAALSAVPSVQTLQLTSMVLKSAGLSGEMAEIVEEHQPNWPRNPWIRMRLVKQWDELNQDIKNSINKSDYNK
jgi:hypothetical protein